MGLDVDQFVISDPRHYGAFVCAICQTLVDPSDAVVTTVCAHCFCRNCLKSWLDKSSLCPTCNGNLLYASSSGTNKNTMMMGGHACLVQPLQTHQPLAFRLLQNIHVKCSLQGVDCSWTGDYGDLQDHLVSPTAHASIPVPMDTTPDGARGDQAKQQQVSLALSLKEEANNKFASRHYREALLLYSQALGILDRMDGSAKDEQKSLLAILYNNRAAAHYNLKNYPASVDDCKASIQADPLYVKAYSRLAHSYVALGSFSHAESTLHGFSQAHPEKTNTSMKNHLERIRALARQFELGQEQLDNQQFAQAKATFSRLLKESEAPSVVLGTAKANLGMGFADAALRLSTQVLKQNPRHAQACLVRGQALVLMNEAENGVNLIRESLRLDPDSIQGQKALKHTKRLQEYLKQAESSIYYRKFLEAVKFLTEAIAQSDPCPPRSALFAHIHTRRAEVYLRLKDYDSCLKDCALVLYAQEDHIPAWLVRFQAYHGLGRHEAALEEVTALLSRYGDGNNGDARLRSAYEKADFEVRRAKRPDYYGLLGVSSIASNLEIKKAYKAKCLEYHPDKHSHKSLEEQKEAEKAFQLLGEAMEVLTDDFQRKLYDEGYDHQGIRDRMEAAQRAASRGRSGHHGHY